MIKASELFDLSECVYADLFGVEAVWAALSQIKDYIRPRIIDRPSAITDNCGFVSKTAVIFEGKVIFDNFSLSLGDVTKKGLKVTVDGQVLEGASVIFAGAFLQGQDIMIGKGTVVETGALVKGPSIIGDYTEVRQGAYVRGSCLIGNNCVVGHTTEMKNAVMLNGAKAGHFAYIGDSILGNNINLGAGTKLANLKITGSNVSVMINEKKVDTGLKKMGAILGDNAETGCNTVTNPGTILGKGVMVYPNTSVKAKYYCGIRLITSKNV